MAGFCHIMREEQNLQNRKSMLEYLISLLDDVNDFFWDATKVSHAVLLCRIGKGKLVVITKLIKYNMLGGPMPRGIPHNVSTVIRP